MKITHIIVFLLAFTISSCVHKIDYLKSDIEQIPVVNCLFQEDSIFQVYVGLSKEIFSDQSTTIPDANVYIIANSQDTFFLEKKNEYLYESTEVAHNNVEYTLVVETQQYNKITATNTIPSYKPTIDTVIPDYFSVLNDYEITSNYYMTFTDNVKQDNYYELSVIWDYSNNPNTCEMCNFYTTSNLLNYENYNLDKVLYLPFSDNSFDTTNLINVITYPYRQINDTSGIILSGTQLIINIKSTSRDYYLYRKSLLLNGGYEMYANWSMEDISNMLFVEKNIKLHTNINNGLGIFAGYSLADQFFIDSIPFAM